MINVTNWVKLGYKINSDGYRAPEFNTVDWSQSYVTMGCSSCFGVGVDDNQTVASYLEQRLGKPVINLGVSGSSIEFQLYNSIEMLEAGIKPLGVFLIAPNPDRYVLFNGKQIEHVGSWSKDEKLIWMLNQNSMMHNYYNYRAFKLIWPCPVITLGYHDTTEGHTDCFLDEFLDKGSDGEHWGPKTAEYIAQMLYQRHLKDLS